MTPKDVMNAYLNWYWSNDGRSLMVEMAGLWKDPCIPHVLFWALCQDEESIERVGKGAKPHHIATGLPQKNTQFRHKKGHFDKKI